MMMIMRMIMIRMIMMIKIMTFIKKKNIFNPKILFWSDISECLIYCRSALIPMQMDLLEPILEKVVFGLTLFSMTMGKLW